MPKISNEFTSNASPAQFAIKAWNIGSTNPIENRKSQIQRAGSRIRTDDLLITNQLLYQLSYAGVYEGKYSLTRLRRVPFYTARFDASRGIILDSTGAHAR